MILINENAILAMSITEYYRNKSDCRVVEYIDSTCRTVLARRFSLNYLHQF
jgi:flagellar biosynthesis/type III secretory pathway ATPase